MSNLKVAHMHLAVHRITRFIDVSKNHGNRPALGQWEHVISFPTGWVIERMMPEGRHLKVTIKVYDSEDSVPYELGTI